jgi:tetratricopeptide (TPR) repeat protein
MHEDALREFQEERELSGHAWAELGIGHVYAKIGRPEEARSVLDKLFERSETEYVSPFILASFHFVLGENDKGFKLLNKAYEEHDPRLHHLKIASEFDNVRSDPQYIALLKKMNLDQ